MYYFRQGEPLYLPADIEQMAKREQMNAMESDEREGIIQDFLDKPLPVDWDDMNLRDRQDFAHDEESLIGDKRVGTVRRTMVSTLEIWCECLYKDRGNLRRSDSNEIIAILERLGWKRREKKQRIPLYGMQYVFERPENDPDSDPDA